VPGTSSSLPAPTGGWNTRDALADMPETHAVILDNWFPETEEVRLRGGSVSHATGMSGAVETLMEYTPLTGSSKLFAANNNAIYDASGSGDVGAADVSSLSNDRWQHVNVGTAAGQYLFCVNGADTPRVYDGSTWSTTTATGPTMASLIWCNLHQRRLWFGEQNSLSAWYLGVDSITGAATEFKLGGIATQGGYLMAMATWTQDAGDGKDDAAVFLTSEGEAIVYQGTDPNDATKWALVGVFRIGKPIGRRCMIKAGPDLVMVTEDGFVTASSILSVDRTQARLGALSDQINKAVNDAVRDYGGNFGWQPVLYPRGTMMLFNVPVGNSQAHQYVFNTITGAPARFTGQNVVSLSLLNDELYGGTYSGTVIKLDTGNSDLGSIINGDALQAFNYFGSKKSKAFRMAEPIFTSSGDPNPSLDFYTDFTVTTPIGSNTASPVSAAKWGSGKWGIDKWGTDGTVYRGWRGITGIGRSGALRVRVDTNTQRPSWVATNYQYVPGGLL